MSTYYDCFEGLTIIDGVAYPTTYDHPDAIRQMKMYDKMRSDDVIICSYPRSGTHWAIALVDLVMREGDTEAADNIHINFRSQWMHISQQIWSGEVTMAAEGNNPMREAEMLPSPRLLTSHLSYNVMPESVQQGKCKVVVVQRNPKSVLNSRYKYETLVPERFLEVPTFDTFLDSNLTDAQDRAPNGTWLNHVSGWWQNRDKLKGNIHFLNYEDMVQDMPKVVTGLAKFLDKNLTQETINKISEYLKFENMKKNPKTDKAFEKVVVYAGKTD
ncbi:unnamed protein product, partial [Owenia fusiformis]